MTRHTDWFNVRPLTPLGYGDDLTLPRPVQGAVSTAVFDRGRVYGGPAGAMAMGLLGGTHEIHFRRTAKDRHVAKRNVTAILMGDPEPGRVKW